MNKLTIVSMAAMLMVFVANAHAAGSPNLTTSNLSIPSNIANVTNVTSVPQMLSYSFMLPYFGMGLIILAFGIGAVRHRVGYGVLAAFVLTIVLFGISPKLISVADIATLGSLTGATLLYELFAHPRK